MGTFDIDAIPDEDLGMLHADPAMARRMAEAIGRGVGHCRLMAESEDRKTKLKAYLKKNEKEFGNQERIFLRRAIKLVNQCGIQALLDGLNHTDQTPLYTIQHSPYYAPTLEALARDTETRSAEFLPTEAEAVTRALMLLEEGRFAPDKGGLYKQAFAAVREAMPEKNVVAIIRGVDLAVKALQKLEIAAPAHAKRAERRAAIQSGLMAHLNKTFGLAQAQSAAVEGRTDSGIRRPYATLKPTPDSPQYMR